MDMSKDLFLEIIQILMSVFQHWLGWVWRSQLYLLCGVEEREQGLAQQRITP